MLLIEQLIIKNYLYQFIYFRFVNKNIQNFYILDLKIKIIQNFNKINDLKTRYYNRNINRHVNKKYRSLHQQNC